MKYDTKGTNIITAETLKEILSKLYNDECNIGKVPVKLNDSDFKKLVKMLRGKNDDGEDILIREIASNINVIEWRLLNENELRPRIDKLYAEVLCF